MNFPEYIEMLKVKLVEALVTICSAVDNGRKAGKNFLFTAPRTDAGRKLLPYYLCYFLFVDLLGFKNHGQLDGYTSISGAVA
jgi:hypothetical protein